MSESARDLLTAGTTRWRLGHALSLSIPDVPVMLIDLPRRVTARQLVCINLTPQQVEVGLSA